MKKKKERQEPVRDLTESQAAAEAIRRWGQSGAIRLRSDGTGLGSVKRGRLARYRCTVGDGGLGEYRSMEGQGDSWLEAFLDAKPIVTVSAKRDADQIGEGDREGKLPLGRGHSERTSKSQMARLRQVDWTTWSANITGALEEATCAQTSEAATVSGDTLRHLIENLQDNSADNGDLATEVTTALNQLHFALDRVTKLRHKEREFVESSAEDLVEELMQKDALAMFGRKYQGRHLRWRVKFAGRSDDGGFIAHVGAKVEVACTLDPCVPDGALDVLEPWQMMTIEGRCVGMEAFGNARDPRRAKLVFDQCLIV